MLEIIKFGTGIAGYAVPALASLKVIDIVDTAQSTVDSVTSKVIQGLSLAYLEQSRASIPKSEGIDTYDNAMASQQDLITYLAGVDGLEGVDLRQLESYLATNDSDNLYGNLYRMTTENGLVKWVCRDHYKAIYHETRVQKLRDVSKLAGGMFDEQLGRIEISMKSTFAATELYSVISKAKGIL